MTESLHVTAPPPATTAKFPLRSIVLLAGAGFASQAMVRVTDSLLPQIAADFGTTVGQAAIVIAAYAVAHGSIQLIIGPIADRFGKYRTVAIDVRARHASWWRCAAWSRRCRRWRSRALPPAPRPAGSFRSRWPMSAT